MKLPDYSQKPEHYKTLIDKINTEVNFPVYLNQLGYELIKKSSGSMEFKNEDDRIVLNTDRRPITYFNRNDSMDKGLFFAFIKNRNANFYQSVKEGLAIIDRIHELEEIPLEVIGKRTGPKSLEENYTIVPLLKMDYLTRTRAISETTIMDPLFKGRIFNAFHIRDNGGKLGNIAFPKFDCNGNPKNYILYNRPYRDRADDQIKKFRLVLNKKDNFLFYSKPLDSPKRIVFGESGIDLLSYHELHGNPDNFYVSFGGTVYSEKLSSFVQLVNNLRDTKKVTFVSIMDNDVAGRKFDVQIFTALVNNYNPNIHIESNFRNGTACLTIHYKGNVGDRLLTDNQALDKILKTSACTESKNIRFLDKLVLEFPLENKAPTTGPTVSETIIKGVNGLYLNFGTEIHKSVGKDWNDDLRDLKEHKYLKKKLAITNTIQKQNKSSLNISY